MFLGHCADRSVCAYIPMDMEQVEDEITIEEIIVEEKEIVPGHDIPAYWTIDEILEAELREREFGLDFYF